MTEMTDAEMCRRMGIEPRYDCDIHSNPDICGYRPPDRDCKNCGRSIRICPTGDALLVALKAALPAKDIQIVYQTSVEDGVATHLYQLFEAQQFRAKPRMYAPKTCGEGNAATELTALVSACKAMLEGA